MPKKDFVRINVDLSPDMAKNFSDACYWSRVTKADVLRAAIANFVKTQENTKS